MSDSDVNNFLDLTSFSYNKFLIYGNEPSLQVKVKNHILKKENLKMIEKISLDVEKSDFVENFKQAVLSNSLFNKKKIIFINLRKNRLNKDLINSLQVIAEHNSENLCIIEIENISKNLLLRDIFPIFSTKSHIIECSIVNKDSIAKFLKKNLPKEINDSKNINNLIELYEGNFSYLVNDIEIMNILNYQNENKILSIFNDCGIRKNTNLIELISKKESKQALAIIDSMKNNDRNSINLLIWILSRDCNAINSIKNNNSNLISLGIWDNQIKWYKEISKRISSEQIKYFIKKLNEADKNIKGVIKGDPWLKAKDIVLSLTN